VLGLPCPRDGGEVGVACRCCSSRDGSASGDHRHQQVVAKLAGHHIQQLTLSKDAACVGVSVYPARRSARYIELQTAERSMCSVYHGISYLVGHRELTRTRPCPRTRWLPSDVDTEHGNSTCIVPQLGNMCLARPQLLSIYCLHASNTPFNVQKHPHQRFIMYKGQLYAGSSYARCTAAFGPTP
jgi:hypothetical protein